MSIWNQIDHHASILTAWQGDGHSIPPHVVEACHNLTQILAQPEVAAAVQHPANARRVNAVRRRYAQAWSQFNAHMEFQVAQTLWPECFTYTEFCQTTGSHPLLGEAADLIAAEQSLFAAHGLNLKGSRVCMVGPGAIPYTCLAASQVGAETTLVDLYEPACRWCREWMHRFFAGHKWHIAQMPGEDHDYANYDLVIVASMLFNRAGVLKAINANPPRHVLLRTTAVERPLGMLEPLVPANHLALLSGAQFLGQSTPPPHVANLSRLYRYEN